MNNTKIEGVDIINSIPKELKDNFILDIITIFSSNDLLEKTNGGIVDILSTYITSDNFNSLSDNDKREFVKTQFDLVELFKSIDEFSNKHRIGKYE